MQKYRYITFSDRKQIAVWYQNGERPADIAVRLGVSVKTIYLELKRGETGELDCNQRCAYDPILAQQKVQENFKRRGRVRANL